MKKYCSPMNIAPETWSGQYFRCYSEHWMEGQSQNLSLAVVLGQTTPHWAKLVRVYLCLRLRNYRWCSQLRQGLVAKDNADHRQVLSRWIELAREVGPLTRTIPFAPRKVLDAQLNTPSTVAGTFFPRQRSCQGVAHPVVYPPTKGGYLDGVGGNKFG